ncbi:hypothetical protein L484_017334 [Morus notabilis]|uniref:Uncharacterized protein n=1 Tax=Morus notabilis TaxID=981085 RepID=W9RP89_9ROSA|nr:hypothetical protein L484_017334 [Morus notabilis]
MKRRRMAMSCRIGSLRSSRVDSRSSRSPNNHQGDCGDHPQIFTSKIMKEICSPPLASNDCATKISTHRRDGLVALLRATMLDIVSRHGST